MFVSHARSNDILAKPRRDFLPITACVIGGLWTLLGSLPFEHRAAAEAVNTDGEPNVTAIAQPGKLKFIVAHPIPFYIEEFKYGRNIDTSINLLDLAVKQQLANKGPVDTKALEQGKLRLINASGGFVRPTRVDLEDRLKTAGLLSIDIHFLGPEDPERKLRWTVTFKDDSGAVLGSVTHILPDLRIAAGEFNSRPARERGGAISLGWSCDHATFDRMWLYNMHSVEVEFENICKGCKSARG